jgi:hypothetical protein
MLPSLLISATAASLVIWGGPESRARLIHLFRLVA